MTLRILGLTDEQRLEFEQTTGIKTEAAKMIVEQAVEEAAQQTAEAIREIQEVVGPHGSVTRVQAGGITITRGGGIGVFEDGVLKTTIYADGNLRVGSNVEEPAETTFCVFVNDQIYNNEEMGEGDLLLGDNTEDTSNIKYDASEGQLQFRTGSTVTAYMDTDGQLKVLAAEIGGWVVDEDSISDAAGEVGLSSAVTGANDVRIWAGGTFAEAVAGDALLIIYEDGLLQATNAVIEGSITATSGSFGGWEIGANTIEGYDPIDDTFGIILDSSVPIIKVGDWAGNHIQIDGANERIRSSNFVTGSAGFNIAADTGDAEFNNITARGELKTFLLTSSNQMAVAGNILISKDAGKLGAAVASGDTTVNFGKSMTVGDWIKIQGPDTAGSNALEWMLVGSNVSGTTYNVTRNVDGSGANNWAKDTPFVVIGQDGDSRIEMIAGASGSIQLITQGAAWNTQTVQAEMSTVDGAITAGSGSVQLFSGGITIENDFVGLSFGVSDPDKSVYLKTDTSDNFFIANRVAGKQTRILITTTDEATPYLTWGEDSSANVSKLNIAKGNAGGKLSIDTGFVVSMDEDQAGRAAFGFDHYIDFLDTATGTGSATVYFNERGKDIDVLIKDIDDTTLLQTDAAGSFVYAKSLKWDGWQKVIDTWTRTGNHTFTVSGDLTAIYRKGAKVKYNDGAVEYGVILSSSHAAGTTTVTLITNTDYLMANTTITGTYLSYVENPEGFPDYFNFTPVIASVTGTITSYSIGTAKWKTAGTTLFEDYLFTISNNGTGATAISVDLAAALVGVCNGVGKNASTGVQIAGAAASGSAIVVTRYDGVYPAATGNQLRLSAAHEF